MYTGFIQSLNNMIYQVEQSELLEEPWAHMYVKEPIKDYRMFTDYHKTPNENLIGREEQDGRIEHVLTPVDVTTSDLRHFNKLMDKLFHTIANKFGDDVQEAPDPTVNFWTDTNKLLINDIHTDEFFNPTSYTISAMIYLPLDNTMKHYGTKLFTYIGDNINEDAVKDEGMNQPHMAHKDKEHLWKHEVTAPYLPNTMFITTNAKGSWHQAPTNIAEGDVRRSVMIRWKCEY